MKYVLLVVLLIVIWYITAQYFPDLGNTFARFEETFNSIERGEETARGTYRAICIELFQSNPLFGNGWEAFTQYFYGTYLGDEKAVQGNTAQNAHNVYFQVLAEQGIIGEILLLLAIGITLKYSINKYIYILDTNKQDSNYIEENICLRYTLAFQIFIILYFMTGNSLYDVNNYIPYFVSLGICCSFIEK